MHVCPIPLNPVKLILAKVNGILSAPSQLASRSILGHCAYCVNLEHEASGIGQYILQVLHLPPKALLPAALQAYVDYIAILELTEEMIRGCARAVATLLKVRAPPALAHAHPCVCGVVWGLRHACIGVSTKAGLNILNDSRAFRRRAGNPHPQGHEPRCTTDAIAHTFVLFTLCTHARARLAHGAGRRVLASS